MKRRIFILAAIVVATPVFYKRHAIEAPIVNWYYSAPQEKIISGTTDLLHKSRENYFTNHPPEVFIAETSPILFKTQFASF